MGQPCPNAFSMIRTSPSAFTRATSNRTSVRDPLGIWPKYSSALAYRRFIWRGITRAAARSKSLLRFASLRQTPIHRHHVRSNQSHRVCHANSATRLENHDVRNLLKRVLLPISPRDTTSHHDCGGFQQLCPSVIFSNVQRQLIYLSAWFAMGLGNGINCIPHRHRLKRFSQHHV